MDKLKALLGHHLLYDEPMAKHTAARIGGPADYLYHAKRSLDELLEVIALAWSLEIPVRILGSGANVLVGDKGIRGLVVINSVSEITFGEWHDGRNVCATSGANLKIVAYKCQAQGISGFEWAVSIPGTIGGAVVNNAGAHGGDMAACVRDVVIMDYRKGPQLLTCEELAYGYRTSALKTRANRQFIVLMATLALSRGEPDAIKAKMDELIAHRKRTQPPGASLGSIFKNPPGDYAGRLIEAAGLKGYCIGGAQVSPVHANFFINIGSATAHDYYALIRYVQEKVEQHSGVLLQPEVELVGEFG